MEYFNVFSSYKPVRRELMVEKRKLAQLTNSIKPSALVWLYEGIRFVLVATKEDVISSHPLFARYRSDPFVLTALD